MNHNLVPDNEYEWNSHPSNYNQSELNPMLQDSYDDQLDKKEMNYDSMINMSG